MMRVLCTVSARTQVILFQRFINGWMEIYLSEILIQVLLIYADFLGTFLHVKDKRV